MREHLLYSFTPLRRGGALHNALKPGRGWQLLRANHASDDYTLIFPRCQQKSGNILFSHGGHNILYFPRPRLSYLYKKEL